jgi:AbrB family looped-hinge helix DNA binding protein
MKVTTRGQVTIPQSIRKQLGIQPGKEVEFKLDGDTVLLILINQAKTHTQHVVERLRGQGTMKLTTDAIMKLTRGK